MPLDEAAHWFVHIVQSGGVVCIWWSWQRQALSSLVTLWISCSPLFVWHFKLNSDEHLLCTFPSGPSSWSKSPTTRSQMKWSIALSSTATMLKFYGMSFLQLRKGLWRLPTICHVALSQREVPASVLTVPRRGGQHHHLSFLPWVDCLFLITNWAQWSHLISGRCFKKGYKRALSQKDASEEPKYWQQWVSARQEEVYHL